MTDAAPQDAPLAPAPVGPPPQPPRGYVAESFGAFFGDPTWFKRSLIGMVLVAVPILGDAAIRGYGLIWMRETAWGGGDTLPTNPKVEDALMGGLRVLGASIVWGFLALVVLLVGILIGSVIYWPIAEMNDARLVSTVVAAVVGAVFGLVGLALFLVSIVLSEVGIARIALYQRAAAGMPFGGLRAFYRLHPWGFWRALGTSLVAGLPVMAIGIPAYVLVSSESLPFAVGALGLLLYLPMYLASFCGSMISARAYGRWLREIDPRTLPPLGVKVADDGSWEAAPTTLGPPT